MSQIKFDDFVQPPRGPAPAASPLAAATGMPSRREIETAVRRLPTLPALLQQLLAELHDIDTDIHQLEERISSDPALTTRILKMANSPFYNNRSEVVSVGRALVILGFKTVSNLVLATSFRGPMTITGRTPGYEMNGIFRHSLASGICCQRLGQILPAVRAHKDELFVAGLLHDIGRIALAGFYRDQLELFEKMDEGSMSCAVESELLGLDHTDAGRLVVEHWGLPEEFLAPVTRHHEDPEALAGEPVTLAVVAVDCFLNGRGFARKAMLPTPQKLEQVAGMLGTSPDTIRELLDDFEEELSNFQGAAG